MTYTRTAFSSMTDQVIIVRLEANRKGALQFSLGYDTPKEADGSALLHPVVKVRGNKLTMQCIGMEQEGVASAIKGEWQVQVVHDGKQVIQPDRLGVQGATTATVYLSAATTLSTTRM